MVSVVINTYVECSSGFKFTYLTYKTALLFLYIKTGYAERVNEVNE